MNIGITRVAFIIICAAQGGSHPALTLFCISKPLICVAAFSLAAVRSYRVVSSALLSRLDEQTLGAIFVLQA